MIASEYLSKVYQLNSMLVNAAITEEEFNVVLDLMIEILKCKNLSKIDKELFREALDPLPTYCVPVTIQKIIEATGKYFEIDPLRICMKNQGNDVVRAREVCIYLMHTNLEMSNKEIAGKFDLKDTQVKSIIEKMHKAQNLDSPLFQKIKGVLALLYPKTQKRVIRLN